MLFHDAIHDRNSSIESGYYQPRGVLELSRRSDGWMWLKNNATEVDTVWLLIMSHVSGPHAPKGRRQMPIRYRNIVLWTSKSSPIHKHRFLSDVHLWFHQCGRRYLYSWNVIFAGLWWHVNPRMCLGKDCNGATRHKYKYQSVNLKAVHTYNLNKGHV